MHSVKRLKIGCFIHKSNFKAFKDETPTGSPQAIVKPRQIIST